jgi:hypothetical protein
VQILILLHRKAQPSDPTVILSGERLWMMPDTQMPGNGGKLPAAVVVAAPKPEKENPPVEAGANVVAAGVFAPKSEDVAGVEEELGAGVGAVGAAADVAPNERLSPADVAGVGRAKLKAEVAAGALWVPKLGAAAVPPV